jgi:eukaryotic-like serine/threonine-protein kinase
MQNAGTLLAGRYRLDEPIATGGMGEVWRATDQTLSRVVAVKLVRAGTGFDARFQAEARTLAALVHPNVVNVYDYGQEPVPYLVMAYVEGRQLSDLIAAAGRLTAEQTMPIVAQAADALQAAHERGVVHRDVKPANLLVGPDGTVTLVDFGVARTPVANSNTTGQVVLGTATYMAPEQASGGTITPATDVYALGAVAYHCLAGRPPFFAPSALEVALRQVMDEPPALPADVPPAARHLVTRAMAKNPADRYPSAMALAADARSATSTPSLVPGAAPGAVPGVVPAVRSHWRSALLGAGAVVLVGLAALGVALWRPDAATTSPRTPSGPAPTSASGVLNPRPAGQPVTRSSPPWSSPAPSPARPHSVPASQAAKASTPPSRQPILPSVLPSILPSVLPSAPALSVPPLPVP